MRVWDLMGEDGVSIAERRGDGKGQAQAPVGIYMPTPAREQDLPSYGALYCFEWRPKGVQGENGGKRVSSGYNRRRRLATRSSGKQQAGRTAVRTAPIVCPEESPLHCINRRQLCRKKFPLAGPDAPTPAREEGLQPYGALYCFGWRSEGVQGASGKPPACINGQQLCRKKFPFDGE